MSGIGNLFSGLTSALNANNITAAVASATALQGALGTSQAVQAKATMYINNFNLAQATGNAAGVLAAQQGLIGMVEQLPASVQPLIAELSNPSVSANPVACAGVMAQISTAITHSSFL